MAQKADGTIYINTAISADGFTAGGKEIESAARRMAKTVSGIGEAAKIALQKQTDAFVKQNQAYAQQEQKVESLKRKLEELSDQKVETKEYSEITQEVERLESELAKAEDKKFEFLKSGGNKQSWEYQDLEANVRQLSDAYVDALNKKEELESSGGAYQVSDTSGIEKKLFNEEQKLHQMANALGTSYEALKQKIESLGGSVSGVIQLHKAMGDLKKVVNDVKHPTETIKFAFSSFAENVKDKASGIAASILNKIAHPFQTLKKIAVPVFNKILQLAKSAAKAIGSKLLSGIKKATSAMLGFNKSTNKSNGSLGASLKSLLKYGLGIRSLTMLFNKLRTALKDGFGNLAQYSDPVNKSLSSLKSGLTQLKNSFATAFAPILTVVAPILKQFIDMVSKAVTYVGMFVAALTGQSTFTKATEVQEDYAESLENTASAAKQADKYISGLDEIRTFSDDKTTSSGKGSGGVSAQDMFETVDIPNFVGEWKEKFKEAWENADFTEIGTIFGDKLNYALGNIQWNSIKERCNKIASSIATFINGFVATPDLWVTVGTTIGEGINTAVGMWNTFFDTTNFVAIGSAIAVGLNSILTTVDPTELGRALSQKIRSIIETAYGFVTTFDWGNLGTWFSNVLTGAIDNIPFDTLGDTLGTALTGLFDVAINFADTFDWTGFGDKISSGINGLFETFDGGKLAEGASKLITGLLDTIIEVIETTDWAEIWKDIIDFLVDVDIVGILDKLLTACIDLIEGLLGGLVDAIEETDWSDVWDKFLEALKFGFTKANPMAVLARMGWDLILGLSEGLTEKFETVKKWMSKLPGKFKTYFSEAKTKITETFSNIGTWFRDKFSAAWTNIKSAFSLSNAKTFFSNVWSGITSAFGNVSTWFKDKFSSAWTAVKDVFSKGGKIFDGIKDGILNGLKTVINGIITGINKVISVPFNGLNDTLLKLKKIEVVGIKPFGWVSTFKVPQIPKLATGAVIPPNAPFLAMLGDQKRGTNVEAPLSTIEDAVRKVMLEMNGQNNRGNVTYQFTAQVNRRTLFEEMMDEAKLVRSQTGRNPFAMA